ncbi:MAG: hypothetical protein GEV05_07610 [Betaproteobacteria bacterium]|nr:hypothetical protein [Betaproteobacteria bacterium]
MNRLVVFAIAIAVAFLSGCALPGSRGRAELLNPRPIHVSADPASDAAKAENIPADSYYKALELARTTYSEASATRKDAGAIANYVDEGIGLVNAYCLRWFHRIDDVRRQVDLEGRDWNIVRQLGTAILGIAGANSNWVAAYGAGNTAYEGVLQNFNDSIVAGPTTKKIKGRVFALLEESASVLRTQGAEGSLPFPEAYSRLERHADICTFSTIRELLDSSLAQTQSTIDAKTGEIRSKPRELDVLSEPEVTDRAAATLKIIALLRDGDLEKTRAALALLGLVDVPQDNLDEARESLRKSYRERLRDRALAAKIKAQL